MFWLLVSSSLVYDLDSEEHSCIDFPMDPIKRAILPVLGPQLGTGHISMTS